MPAQQTAVLAQEPTIRVQSSLLLVDVITQDRKSGLPVRDFKNEDFRLFDNGHEVQIATFGGVRTSTRTPEQCSIWTPSPTCRKVSAVRRSRSYKSS